MLLESPVSIGALLGGRPESRAPRPAHQLVAEQGHGAGATLSPAAAAVQLLRLAEEVAPLESLGGKASSARPGPDGAFPGAGGAGAGEGPRPSAQRTGDASFDHDKGSGQGSRFSKRRARASRDAGRGQKPLALNPGSPEAGDAGSPPAGAGVGLGRAGPGPGLGLVDELALAEAAELVQPLLGRMGAGQLQRCLETLAAARHPPPDPWLHDFLSAAQALLTVGAADAAEVYGMLAAMRALRVRPPYSAWLDGAYGALSKRLNQLSAEQAVDLLGCFADLALQPPDKLLARSYALLLPDLSYERPELVVDFLAAVSKMRRTPPAHVMEAAYAALPVPAIVAAPPAALCALAAALAGMRAQPPAELAAALAARAEAVVRLAVGPPGSQSLETRGAANVGAGATLTGGGRKTPPQRQRLFPLAPEPNPAGETSLGPGPLSPDEASDGAESWDSLASLRAAAEAAEAEAEAQVDLTPERLSCLLRDLHRLGAPLPPALGPLCGAFIETRAVTARPTPTSASASASTASTPGGGATRASEPGPGSEPMSDPGAVTPVSDLLYLLGSVARAKLRLPPSAVAAAATRLEASLRAATRGRRRAAAAAAAAVEAETEPPSAEERTGSANAAAAAEWSPQVLATATTALQPYASLLPASLISALYDNLYDTLESATPGNLTATLHALPALAFPPQSAWGTGLASRSQPPPPPPPPPQLLASYLSCLAGRVRRLEPHQLSMALYALVQLRVRPDPAWMEAVLVQIFHTLPAMNEVQISGIAWCVAKMSYRPHPVWADRLLSAAAGRLSCFPPRHLAKLLWAVGAMGYQPGKVWMGRWLEKARSQFRTTDGPTLAAQVWAVAAVGHCPDAAWLEDLCAHLHRRIAYLEPRALTNALAALAAVRHSPGPDWLAAAGEHMRARLGPSASTAALAQPLPSYPSTATGAQAAAGGGGGAGGGGRYSLRDLAEALHALSRLGHVPADAAWSAAVTAAVGRLSLLGPPTPPGRRQPLDLDLDDADQYLDPAAAAAAHAKHVSLAALAASRLGCRPSAAAWHELLDGFHPLLPAADPQSIVLLLAAAATLRLPLPRDHAGALLLATHRRMRAMSGEGLAVALRAWVAVGVHPGGRWLGRLAEELAARRQRVAEAAAAEAAAGEGEGGGGDEEGEEGVEGVEEGFGLLEPWQRSAMLWALATLETCDLEDPSPSSPSSSSPLSSRSFPSSSSSSSRSHSFGGSGRPGVSAQGRRSRPAAVTAPVAAQGLPPPPPRWIRRGGPLQHPLDSRALLAELLPLPPPPPCPPLPSSAADGAASSAAAAAVAAELASYSGRDLAVACWALGRLRLRPRGLVAALLTELRRRMEPPEGPAAAAAAGDVAGDVADGRGQALSPQELSLAFWGLSSIGVWPSVDWQAAAAGAALAAARAAAAAEGASGGGGLPPRVMAGLLAALARWRRVPRVKQHRRGKASGQRRPRRDGAAEAAAVPAEAEAAEAAELEQRTAALAALALEHCAERMPRPRASAPAPSQTSASAVPLRVPSAASAVPYDPRSLVMLTWALASLVGARRHPSTADPGAARADVSTLLDHTPSPATTPLPAGGPADAAQPLPPPPSPSPPTTPAAAAAVPAVAAALARWSAAFLPAALGLMGPLPGPQRVVLLDAAGRLGLRPGADWREAAEQAAMRGGLSPASAHRGLQAALQRLAGEMD
ncbi:hypothetical protein HYH03_014186 [Edaphochlamys debaryana]|uniref:Uncharacterized protein n=1 Tax=Edaphochlamys debaryana TaxID=47281 RepID=A0A836BSJ9_9CHLO|nr:hypothetical protein HYH03_014186 [Edaphochlamys debaryana]|eukprot:KAG2487212.1 hypothetical protein HYH03_014186 [Edaphochlamys debaryana]